MYATGQGVPQDYVQAHMWLNLASRGFPGAVQERDESARNSMIIQMYVSVWGTDTGKNEIVDVEFEHAGKIKNY